MKPALIGEAGEHLGRRNETGIINLFLKQFGKPEIGFDSRGRLVRKARNLWDEVFGHRLCMQKQ